ncbi:hypothetical protein GLYMA_03G121400v4 [Glycine max]|nr:hypothetical protein GLYMA_03G121400v4 [Glycine max]KAH1069638.1 hypothetical protein GYH30_007005 [Glycine max]
MEREVGGSVGCYSTMCMCALGALLQPELAAPVVCSSGNCQIIHWRLNHKQGCLQPDMQRFLAESTVGNESTNSTICDEVCQLKSSLLEGILVRVVNMKIAEFPILGCIRNNRVRVKDTTFSSRLCKETTN